ncbi:response regulator [Litoreibacter roseus]|uniref:Response regulator n=1 Tax=Litoreibacter roseus TaxID=2601869 RepID=A0A6N6JDP5_9RHOB|nr:response regulator [Litoreibacter roseus]GFE64441.1 response regulator [Litoreibacter roseus]
MLDKVPNYDIPASAALRYLRRHARALTRNQVVGDRLAEKASALLRLQDDTDRLPFKLALFRTFHRLYAEHFEETSHDIAQIVFLLRTIEKFSIAEIGKTLGQNPIDVLALFNAARAEMLRLRSLHILLIEDEAMIAMDLSCFLEEQGHKVTGVAMTHAGAVGLAYETRPDLIISDIALADRSSGLTAVDDIVKAQGHIPAIFLTGRPDLLLTGEGAEPAFVLEKPYGEDEILSAMSQAMSASVVMC